LLDWCAGTETLVSTGVLQATMAQNPFQKSCLGIQAAVDASLGKSVQKNVDTGLTVVTKANMDSVK